jgi:hypothetical protein
LSNVPFSSGSSIYTSGLFGQLTQNAIKVFDPANVLTMTSLSVDVTAVQGSFDLIGATADFEHIIYTSGTNQLSVPGVFVSSVPEPATFALLGGGIAGLAASRRRA